MEQYFPDSVSSSSKDQFSIPFVNVPKQVGSGIWGNSHGNNAAFKSTDTSLFSSSLPVLPHAKLNFANLDHSHQSPDDGLSFLNKLHQEAKDPCEAIKPHAINSVLPEEDDLLAGLMDDFDLSGLPNRLEDLEDDFFSSGGGMELEADPQDAIGYGMSRRIMPDGFDANGVVHYGFPNGVGTVTGEHPYGEHPSRTLFVRNIYSNVEDSELKTLFEEYGDIRSLYTACKHRGFVMISYYDIRAARTAMRALQNKPLRRRKLDIHFSIPKDNPSEKDVNQGTLVVFNLDALVSNDDLQQLFGAYGEVKEIRETPNKRHHKFIEFYDVRAADAALKALNGCEIGGKRIKLEPSRPGGARRNLMQQLNQELELEEARSFQMGSPVTSSPPGNWGQIGSPVECNPLRGFGHSQGLGTFSLTNYNHLPGLASILPNQSSNSSKIIAPIGKIQGGMNQLFTNARSTERTISQHSHSLPDQTFTASSGLSSSFGETNSSGIGTLSGPEFLWGSPTSSSEVQTNSSSGHPFVSREQKQLDPYSGGHRYFLGSHHHHHVGSAPSGIPHFGYFPGSPDSLFRHSVVSNNIGLRHNNGSYVMNMSNHEAINDVRMMALPTHGPIFFGNGSFPGLVTTNSDERGRKRVDNSESQIDSKKQYQLDLNKIINEEDTRTTLMIKNIPNKYTSKMLLASIDENHRGTYDFIYLPIDFKNKCNVGYAFINMVSPSLIASFYKEFNGKKWEKFNSEKVASLAYARIQGKAALVTHFQNSSLMNEDRWCRPILFHYESQDTCEQEVLPSSNLNICIRQPDGSYSDDRSDIQKDNSEESLQKY